jgi:AraC family transcriptional regulator, regulatory protein of adaptative response / DNA-3-methyladenine glycosylase II
MQAIVARADILARLVERHGTAVPGLAELGLTHTFPSPTALAEADLGGLGLTSREAETIRSFARAVADDEVRLDGSVGLDGLIASLTAIEGLDPWTAHSIARRLGEPASGDESSRSQVS